MMEQYGIIDILFQTNLPQITFLTERFPEGYLTLNISIYKHRKKIEHEKLDSLINFISVSNCRSEMIGQYFESDMSKCGTCDVCKSELKSNHSFKELIQLVPTLLPATANEISEQLDIQSILTQQVLHKLILEEEVMLKDGLFVKI